MVPVEEQGASSSTASNGPALPLQRVGGDGLGLERQPREVFAQAGQPVGRAVDRGDARAGAGELRGLAAGRRAQIGDAQPAHVAEQARRQRGGGVLHPPGAFGKARQQRDRAMRDGAHRAGRQHAAAQMLGPNFRILLHGEIERRLVAIGLRDGARDVAAVGLGPALEQPVRRVARRLVGQHAGAVLRHAAQHGIDQPGVARGAAVGLRQAHRQIDRGVVGNLEPEDLRGAEQQNGLGARRVGGKSLVEETLEQMAQGAEPAQHGGGEPAHQRAVAVGERGEAGMRALARELLVERDAPPQHAVDDVGGNSAGGEAGDFRLRGGARSRHAAPYCHEMWRGRECTAKNIMDATVSAAGRRSSWLSCIFSSI